MKGVFIMKKRVVSIILVIALMLSALSITAFAADEQNADVSSVVDWVHTILQGIHNIHVMIYNLISVLIMDLFYPIVPIVS